MRLKFWKRFSIIAGGIAFCILVLLYLVTYTGTNIFPNQNKRHAMIRLEDIRPGGEYNTREGLGKLRAVIEYVESENIPFHVAVIPRSKEVGPDGIWRERGIDDSNPDFITRAFINLLKEAEKHGGILGMHGYSHQYGDSIRKDDNHNSGTGAEFNIDGAPETQSNSYAAERITKSLSAFAEAGLQPAFWESPHYQDTREQEKVFRSFMGILYQPDWFSLRSLKDINVYDSLNYYGQNSLGSVYVPAPYSYVTDEESVKKILSKTDGGNGLASLFFHPFLEFPYLEPVFGSNGKPKLEDGIPVYRYKDDGTYSYLHQLIKGFKEEGYRWMSLYDIIPFTPAHRVTIPSGVEAQNLLIGDVIGNGHADIVIRELHRILVVPGTYEWPRNRPQPETEIWLEHSFTDEEQLQLADFNKDGKQDLLAYNRETGEVRISWAGEGRFLIPKLVGRLPARLESLRTLEFKQERGLVAVSKGQVILIPKINNQMDNIVIKQSLPEDSELLIGKFQNRTDDEILLLSSKDHRLTILQHQGEDKFREFDEIEGVSMTPDDQLKVGDFNGDGKSDLIVYSTKRGVWREYKNKGNQQFEPLENDFGPWAHGKERIAYIADFDGNGKTDIASYNKSQRVLDLSLSFQNHAP